jgi:RNA recognition motif-containing protein
MKKSLFVAGLDYSLTNENLKNLFSEFGTVETAKIITDKFSGQSRGFGFVEMSTQEEAQQCIANLHNTTQNNRQIIVKFKEDKPAGENSRSNYKQRW